MHSKNILADLKHDLAQGWKVFAASINLLLKFLKMIAHSFHLSILNTNFFGASRSLKSFYSILLFILYHDIRINLTV